LQLLQVMAELRGAVMIEPMQAEQARLERETVLAQVRVQEVVPGQVRL
jgi:hypothetical protein